MPAEQRLAQVLPKLERAKHHVHDLESAVDGFLEGKPYKVRTEQEANPGYLGYYIDSVEQVPAGIRLIAGDAIQNLVSALDHLAYQIVCSDTADNPPKPHAIYFPIERSLDAYEREKSRKVQGASPASIAAIDALKPYQGGNSHLWMLHALNNIEKHRLLIAVGAELSRIVLKRMTGEEAAAAIRIQGGTIRAVDGSIPKITSAELTITARRSPFPLEAGVKLFSDRGDPEADPYQKFRFDVAFNEPGVIERESLRETVHQMVDLVEGIIGGLKLLLR